MADEKVSKVAQPQAAEVTTAPVQAVSEVPVKELRATGEADADTGVEADDYSKTDLQNQARQRGLDDSGSKSELADRINEHDEKGVHKPEVLYPHESE